MLLQQLVEARASRIITSQVDEESDILKIALSQNILPDAPAYTRQRSNSKCIPCDWKLKDNYESVTVFRQITLRIVGYHFPSQLTATLNLCPIYLKLLVHVL